MDIGHEVYHRVTMCRNGMRRELWVDEMLACLSSYKILRSIGMDTYAFATEQACLERQHSRLNVHTLRQIRLKRNVLSGMQRHPYPTDFRVHVTNLGQALLSIVGWDQLSNLAFSTNLNEWKESLTKEQQSSVYYVLGLSETSKPSMVEDQYKLGVALRWVGDLKGSIHYLQLALHSSPDDIYIRYDLSESLFRAKQIHDAIKHVEYLLKVDPENSRLRFTLGNFFMAAGNFDDAISHLQSCIDLDSDCAMAHYYLGQVFYAKQDTHGARKEWLLAVETGDSLTANSARKALAETSNPDLPATTIGQRR